MEIESFSLFGTNTNANVTTNLSTSVSHDGVTAAGSLAYHVQVQALSWSGDATAGMAQSGDVNGDALPNSQPSASTTFLVDFKPTVPLRYHITGSLSAQALPDFTSASVQLGNSGINTNILDVSVSNGNTSFTKQGVLSPSTGYRFLIYAQPSSTTTGSPQHSASYAFNITFDPCAVACPSNITVQAPIGQCSNTVNYATPTVPPECPAGTTVSCSPPSGAAFPVGTNTVTCTTTFPGGGEDTCQFLIVVKPGMQCPPTQYAMEEGETGQAVVTFPEPTGPASCPFVNVECVPPSGSSFPVGTTTVNCTGTDSFGNQSTCAFDVVVLDSVESALDPDGDGLTNEQEVRAGTDPFDANSSLRITAIAKEGNDIRVTWMTGPGKTNALQRSTVVGSGYGDIFTVTNTTGSVTNHLDVGAASSVPTYSYRVRLVP